MKDAAKGETGEYNIERDDGKVNAHTISDYTGTILDWNESERLGIQHAKGRVLDIGCGAGRVSLFLQEQGYDVVGIDLASGAIEACKTRGLKKAYVMSADELDFPESTFDTIIMYGNNFGILGEDPNIVNMLESLKRITTPEGIILAGSVDVQQTDDQSNIAYQKKNLERNRPIGLIRLRVKYKDLVGDWTELRLAGPEEMKGLAERAGWKLSRVYQHGSSFVGILTKRRA